QHARRLGQLKPVRIFLVEGDACEAFRNRVVAKGAKTGDVKFLALSLDMDWPSVFTGHFVV
ncbi:MAG: hypothetical protein AAB215_07090, partial [Planctomycetota bacterium]